MHRGLQGVLLVLSFAVAATVLAPRREAVSYQEAISLAVLHYNLDEGPAFAFRLLEANNRPEWDSQKRDPQNLKFVVKETICPNSEQVNPDECDFQEDGIIQHCSGTFARPQAAFTIQLHCVEVAEETSKGNRVRRNTIQKLIGKIKRKFRVRPGAGSLIAQGGKRSHGRIA